MTLVQTCDYEPLHEHEYPDDWQFGGPSGTDPRQDPRFEPASYQYLDAHLEVIHSTSHACCDDEAIDYFTQVAESGPTMRPVWLRVRRPGETTFHTLPFQYNPDTDEVYATA